MTNFGSTSWPAEYDRQLRDELEDGEQLLWADRPAPGRMALQAAPIFVFGLFFGGFAIFWEAMAMGIGHGRHLGPGLAAFLIFPLFGLPFVVIGLLMVLAPYFAYIGARKTIYGVTDRRAIVITKGLSRTIRSYHGRDFDSIQRNERGDGTGDVVFAHQARASAYGYRNPGIGGLTGVNQASVLVGFFGIRQPREVERLIKALVDGDGRGDGRIARAGKAR